MPSVLSVNEIKALACSNGLDVREHFPKGSVENGKSPSPVALSVWFREESADVWEKLMSSLTEVPVTVLGTRQVTGSGATDNILYPAYAERLSGVNSIRASIGLEPIFR